MPYIGAQEILCAPKKTACFLVSKCATLFTLSLRDLNMLNENAINDFFEKTNTLFGSNALKDDMEKQFRALVQSQLRKLDMVSRDEFDAQTAVLERTREKLDALEKQLEQLTEQINPNA